MTTACYGFRVDFMEWQNGTRTEIEVDGGDVVITDIHPSRLTSGEHVQRRDADQVMDLADEHDVLSRKLRQAAIEATRNASKEDGR